MASRTAWRRRASAMPRVIDVRGLEPAIASAASRSDAARALLASRQIRLVPDDLPRSSGSHAAPR